MYRAVRGRVGGGGGWADGGRLYLLLGLFLFQEAANPRLTNLMMINVMAISLKASWLKHKYKL